MPKNALKQATWLVVIIVVLLAVIPALLRTI
jgi:hypothetical protein